MSLSKSESDVILNRANVALTRSQRLVSSWLPAQTEDELANAKTEEELQREEDEIFTAVPETYVISFSIVCLCVAKNSQPRNWRPSASKSRRWKLESDGAGLERSAAETIARQEL